MKAPVAALSAIAAVALGALAPSAPARLSDDPGPGLVLRFPSGELPNLTALQNAIASPSVSTIVIERGTYTLDSTLFVFSRDDLTICGATGDPRDVLLQMFDVALPPGVPPPPAVEIVQARRITLRNLTVRSLVTRGAALLLNAAFSSEIEAYADDTVVDRCVLEGYIGAQASVRTRNFTLTASRVSLTGSPVVGLPALQGGVGVLWEDGPGLFVGRTRFTTQGGVASVAGIFVRGAQTADSEGDRARRIVLTRNSIDGNFARGFLLDDITDSRLRENRIRFPSPLTDAGVPGIASGSGRVGILVLRANASSATEDFELFHNQVRRAYYGAWLVNTGDSVVRANDFRSCGSTTPDPGFVDATVNGGVDHGGGLRLNLQFAECGIVIERNDFRKLRSPVTDPAVVVFPGGSEPLCFPDVSASRNRVGGARELYLGASERSGAPRTTTTSRGPLR